MLAAKNKLLNVTLCNEDWVYIDVKDDHVQV